MIKQSIQLKHLLGWVHPMPLLKIPGMNSSQVFSWEESGEDIASEMVGLETDRAIDTGLEHLHYFRMNCIHLIP
jgi:hypothetical protein